MCLTMKYQTGYIEGLKQRQGNESHQIDTHGNPSVVVINNNPGSSVEPDRRHHRHHHHHYKAKKISITDNEGNVHWGYHCIKSSFSWKCSQNPDPEVQCVQSDNGELACGYGCATSSFKAVCSPKRGYTCHIGKFDQVICGKNCVEDNWGKYSCAETL